MIHHTKKFCCYAELLQLSDNAIYTWRLDGEIDSWNHGAELLYGFNETEALGHNSHDLLQTCFPCPLREMESVLRQSRHWEGELVEQTKDGRTVTVSTKFLLVYGEDEVERVLEITRDITEHKRMENENRSLTKFLSENPNPILRLSREGVILYTNEASGALLQMWDCVIGDTVPESFYQVVTETFISHLERTVDIECNQRIYSLNIVLIADMGYVNIYGSDITERKRVEKLLRESEAHFRVAVKNSNFVLSQFDRDLRYTWMHNPHPDFDASLMIDRRGEELENSQGMRRLDALKRQVLENGKGVREEIFFDRSDGQHTYDMIIEPIYDGAGAVIGGTSCALDITGHKRAEVALMESKAKLELVFSSMNDALFFVSADGELIDFNDAFVSFYRFKEREECIRTISGYLDYHEEWFPDGTPVPVSMGPVCRALRGESGTAQYKIRKKETGETWWASYSFAPMRDKDGKIVGCVCVARDITQQKQMDEALRISEERFRLALIHSPVNISSQDLNLVYTWQYNPQLGYAVDEVIGKTDPELLPFETARQLMDMKQKAIITGTQVRSEVSIVNQNEILYYDFTIEPLRNQQGDIVGVNNIMVDITERKRTEVVLRRQAEMLNLSYEAMFAWELNGVVISWNQGAQRLYGYSSEEAINSSGHELLKTKFPIELDKIKTMLVQDKTWSGELVHTTKNGGTITVESRLQLIQDDLGRLIVLETNRDTTQRKQALEALYETTNYLENLIDYANAPIIVWNPNFRITRFNHAFERLTGLKAGEVIGKFLDILFPESSIADSSDFIERTSKGEFWETVEIPILRTDGTIRTVLWNSANICEKDGVTVAATIAQGQDITERKYAEAALQVKKEELTTANEELQAQQEELAAANEELQSQTEELNSTYQELQRQTEEIRKQAEATARERDVAEQRAAELDATISSIAAGVIIYDNMGNVIRINDYAHILYKFTSDDYRLPFPECLAGLQMHKSDGVPYATEETPLNRALRGEVIRDEEMMIVAASEKPVWISSTWAPIYSNNGDLMGVIFIFTDITESKRKAEDLLASEREMLKVTLNSLGEGVVATDQEEQIVFLNEAAAKLSGYSQDEAIGKPISKIFYILDDKTSEPIEKISSQAALGNPILVTHDLKELVVAMNSAPIKDNDGQVIGTVIVLQDITQKQKIEQELLKAAKLDSLGILAGGVAHDFNNILAGILANLQLAAVKLQKHQDISKYMESTIAITRKASDLTKQLLTFAKGGDPVKKSASITELVKDTVQFALSGSKVKAEFILPEDLWVVNIDEGQIAQVINNLTINAEQAMPTGGILKISGENVVLETSSSYNPGQYVKLIVKDHGIGIPVEIITKIFDPFFTTKKTGNGLGLSTSYSIIKKHNGYLEVESVPGIGTTFYIYLPVSMEELAFKESQKEIAAGGEGRILLMDDEDTIRNVGGEMLTYYGYQVKLARDGQEAIGLYKMAKGIGDPFDAVIMDLTIPGGLGGIETLAILRQIDPEIKAIISSGYASDPVMSDYEKYGFSGVVTKPYKFDELNEVLNRVIDKKQLPLGFTY